MVIRIFVLGLALCLYQIARPQSITGTFVDSSSTPIEFLKVIASADNGIVAGAFTDSTGSFSLQLDMGKMYNIIVTTLSNDTVYTNPGISLVAETDLGTIKLNLNDYQTDDVVITARKKLIIRKVDRLIFNVEYSITSTGGTALDALKITPGIRVREKSIEMIGRSSVLMYMDGRPLKMAGEDLFNFLMSIPASDIKRIEVISNPPANYEAQGNSGVVDIILKSSKNKGLFGSVRASGVQAFYPGGSVGGSFNYSTEKILCYGGINVGDGNIAPRGRREIIYPNQEWIETMWSKTGQSFLNGRLGMDIVPTERSRFGFRYWGGNKEPRIFERLGTSITSLDDGQLDSTLSTNSSVLSEVNDHYINGYYQLDLDSNDKQVVLNVDYFNFKNISSQTFTTLTNGSLSPNNNLYSYNNGVDQDIQSASASLDFDLPMEVFDLKTGAKVSFIQNNSSIESFNLSNGNPEPDPNQTSSFDYTENTQALYASGSKSLGDVEFQIGLRGEYTQTEGFSETTSTLTKNDYFQLFPTAYFSYAPNDTHYFDIKYGRRIDRPAYWRLNPFRRFNSIYSYTEGNPFLQPAFYGNLETSYTYMDALTIGLFYSRGAQGFNEITLVEAQSPLQVTTQQNFLTTHSMGGSVSYYFSVGSFWESSNDVSVYYNQSISDNPSTVSQVDGFTAYASTTNSFVFNEASTFTGELSFYYQFPEVDGIDLFESYYGLSMGLRWKLFDKKLNVSCQMVDMLGSQEYTFNNTINGVSQTSTRYWDTRQLVVGLSYSFGKSGNLSPKNSSSNNEEKNRLN